METFKDLEIIYFKDAQQWEAWLEKHYQLQAGIWIKIAKKASGIPTVDHNQAVDVALCFGWIDGQGRPYDEQYYLQMFTPRRPKSLWSKVNIGKVAALTAAGKMRPSGLKEVEAAKADGRWEAAYESSANATVPPELVEAFKRHKKAEAFFETLNKTNRYAVIWRIATAKTPKTRAARLEKIIAMLEAGEKFH
jgi:uncharacterized protein YdeI (YjbR/CyaY-like superfamily)